MEKDKKIPVSFPVIFEKVEGAEEVQIGDDRFTKVRVYLMHTGLNYNNSIFEKEVVEDAMETLAYIPIVGFIEKSKVSGDDDFSDHRSVIVKDSKGIRRKYIGSAYGVILSKDENNAHFEMRTCDDGVEREFLVVDGLIWNMFEDSANIMERDIIKGHSMELFEDSVEGYEDEDGIFHFTKFSFRAACILGDDYEPAMQNSTVEVLFTVTDFVKQVQDELKDKYHVFTDFVNQNKQKYEGGNGTMPNSEFTLTVMQQFENIAAQVADKEQIADRWGYTYSRYSLVDIQGEEAIVIDRKNHYEHYGLPISMNGDAIEIDFSAPVRKKIVYENFAEGEVIEANPNAFSVESELDSVFNHADEKIGEAETAKSNAETEFATAQEELKNVQGELETTKTQLNEYVAADESRKAKELSEKKDAEFEKFEQALGEALGENEEFAAEFTALKDQKDELSLEEITNKCSVLYTRLSLENKINYTKNNGSGMTAGVHDEDDDAGFIATRYGNIPVKAQ